MQQSRLNPCHCMRSGINRNIASPVGTVIKGAIQVNVCTFPEMCARPSAPAYWRIWWRAALTADKVWSAGSVCYAD